MCLTNSGLRATAMVQPSIPQDIIDHIIESVMAMGYDEYLLRTCTLVSRSFLYPSRKQLFANISLGTQEQCLALLDVLVKHPYIQSYVKILQIDNPITGMYRWRYSNPNRITKIIDENTLLSLLRLPLRSIKTLSLEFSSYHEHDWDPSGNLIETLSDLIRSPSFTSLTLSNALVPTELFLDLNGVRSLHLYNVRLNDVGNKYGISQTAGVNEVQKIRASAAHDRAPIKVFTWHLHGL
jgi:hypothetical protein